MWYLLPSASDQVCEGGDHAIATSAFLAETVFSSSVEKMGLPLFSRTNMTIAQVSTATGVVSKIKEHFQGKSSADY